jgi:ABC-type glutathione transport system ATPase component
MSPTALLDVANLTVTLPSKRGPQPVVDGLSFTVDAGEIVGIAG